MGMRNKYAIRVSLDESRLSTKIDLFDADSVFQIKREITARTFLLASVGAIIYIWIMTHSFIQTGGLLGVLIFTIGYVWITVLTSGVTKDNRDGYEMYKPMYRYLSKQNRNVSTRPLSLDVVASTYVSDIADYDKRHDYILFKNGDVGRVYELSGNASMLAFDSDLSNTIEATQRFYSSVSNHAIFIYDTVTGPQRVVEQINGKSEQIDNLSDVYDYDVHDGGKMTKKSIAGNNIRNLLYAQREVLQEYIGEEFQSVRQYVMIRAINYDTLRSMEGWLYNQQSESGDTYIKSARMLDYNELVDYLKSIFTDYDLVNSDKRNEG